MKIPQCFAALTPLFLLLATVGGQTEKPEDGSIKAKVIAINRGFGFLIVNVGSKQGVKANMTVAILRGERRFEGILQIGEIEETETVLEFVPGKSDPNDKFTEVIFLPPGNNEK